MTLHPNGETDVWGHLRAGLHRSVEREYVAIAHEAGLEPRESWSDPWGLCGIRRPESRSMDMENPSPVVGPSLTTSKSR
jgi:hypothetical protein